jgi:cyclase
MQIIRYQSAYHDAKKKVPIKKPDILFLDSLTINMGDVTFELKYFGRCHSKSDILVYIPELNVLFAGDLMFQYGRPSIRDKSMAEKDIWYRAVEWTEKRMPYIETVIGGHGQIFAKDDLLTFHKNIHKY